MNLMNLNDFLGFHYDIRQKGINSLIDSDIFVNPAKTLLLMLTLNITKKELEFRETASGSGNKIN